MSNKVLSGVVFCCLTSVIGQAARGPIPFLVERAKQIFQVESEHVKKQYVPEILKLRGGNEGVADEVIGQCVSLFFQGLEAFLEESQYLDGETKTTLESVPTGKPDLHRLPPPIAMRIGCDDVVRTIIKNFQEKTATFADGQLIPEDAQQVMGTFLESNQGEGFVNAMREIVFRCSMHQRFMDPSRRVNKPEGQ